MSLFAGRSPLLFCGNDSIGRADSIDSLPVGRGLRVGSGSFLDKTNSSSLSTSDMRVPGSGSTLKPDTGFYDHFDSIFHDLTWSPKSRRFEDFPRGHASGTGSRGREYVIPIRFESQSSSSSTSGAASPAKRVQNSDNKTECNGSKFPAYTSPGSRVIELPVVRETSTAQEQTSVRQNRDQLLSPSISISGTNRDVGSFKPPSGFTLLTPTTEEAHGGKSQSQPIQEDVIYLDHEDFFPNRQSSLSAKTCSSKKDFGVHAPHAGTKRETTKLSDLNGTSFEIKKNRETVGDTLRRKPLRCFTQNDAAETSTSQKTTSQSATTSRPYDAESDDVISSSNAEEFKQGKKISRCCHTGLTNVTASPSYPIYDYLRPRLASIGRQVDYIRGDGNCYFRALSKEMYGNEDYHAEWRQAVCDVIARNPNVFAQYIDGGDVATHVKQMRELGTWATTCEIYATSTLLERLVYVLAPTPNLRNEYHWLLFSPRSLTGSRAGSSVSSISNDGEGSHEDIHPCYLTLCHTNGNHYDRITPVYASCNCRMPPPKLDGVSILMDLTESEDETLMQH